MIIPFPTRAKLANKEPVRPVPKSKPKPISKDDATLIRLIDMTHQTCLVAIDKSLAAWSRAHKSKGLLAINHDRLKSIEQRLCMAVHQVGLTLPKNQRAT